LKKEAENLEGTDKEEKLKDAYKALGRAEHPVMDSTSPTHECFQAWDGTDKWRHYWGERYISPEREQEAIYCMHRIYNPK